MSITVALAAAVVDDDGAVLLLGCCCSLPGISAQLHSNCSKDKREIERERERESFTSTPLSRDYRQSEENLLVVDLDNTDDDKCYR